MQRLLAGCAALALAAFATQASAAAFDPIGDLLQKLQTVGEPGSSSRNRACQP